MSDRAYYCWSCDSMGDWTITRHGDVVTAWACNSHVTDVLLGLRRRGEVTTFTVAPSTFGALIAIEEAASSANEEAT